MRKLFTKKEEQVVTFCERCSEVCDARCRHAALRERTLVQQQWLGVRG